MVEEGKIIRLDFSVETNPQSMEELVNALVARQLVEKPVLEREVVQTEIIEGDWVFSIMSSDKAGQKRPYMGTIIYDENPCGQIEYGGQWDQKNTNGKIVYTVQEKIPSLLISLNPILPAQAPSRDIIKTVAKLYYPDEQQIFVRIVATTPDNNVPRTWESLTGLVRIQR